MSEFRHDKFWCYHDDIDKTAFGPEEGLFSIPANHGNFIFRQLEIVDSM